VALFTTQECEILGAYTSYRATLASTAAAFAAPTTSGAVEVWRSAIMMAAAATTATGSILVE